MQCAREVCHLGSTLNQALPERLAQTLEQMAAVEPAGV